MLAKISNPRILESPHAPPPPPPHSEVPYLGKKSTDYTNWALLEAAQLKGAGCAELRKREHETIKWEEIVRVFLTFFSPTPVSDEEPGTGSGSLGIAGSFFRKSSC